MSVPDDDTPLGKAREWLIDQIEEDETTKCPLCDKKVKPYHRQLYDKLAAGMVIAYNSMEEGHKQEWFHWWRITRIPGGDHARLPLWELMERSSRDRDPREPGVGNYRLTDKGVAFVRNTITVPQCARVLGLRNRFVRWCDTDHPNEINVRTALGEEYDYDKMMGYS